MFYPFPAGLTLDEVRDVIARHNANLGATSFIEADRDNHAIFNYLISLPDSFPQPDTGDPQEDRFRAIIRECRGLIFCKSTGKVLARRFHKFFNVNEKAFTQAHLIDWSSPHYILDKLDGSMITPFRPAGANRVRWGTKMGATEVAGPVEQFVNAYPEYERLAHAMEDEGKTPLLEWCSRKQKIVVDYPVDQLVLTAVRDNHTGAYEPYASLCAIAERFGVPVVRALPGSIENIETFMAEARGIEDAEGYIIAFENGHRLKIKGEWYCAIHGTKDTLSMEKNVLALILNDQIDDLMPFMSPEDRDRVERYMADLNREIGATAGRLNLFVAAKRIDLQGDTKRFALEVAPTLDGQERALCFAIWNRRDPEKVVREHLRKNVGTGPKVNIVRPLINGLSWDSYRDHSFVSDD
jgi:RNA ligase